jgi:hypothetical protein
MTIAVLSRCRVPSRASSGVFTPLLGLLMLGLVLLGPTSASSQAAVAPTPVAEAVILLHDPVGSLGGGEISAITVAIHGRMLPVSLDVGSRASSLASDVVSALGLPPTGLLDSLNIGPTVLHQVPFLVVASSSSEAGSLGADVLSHYDLLFDGPAHLLRLYAQPSASRPAAATPWLPTGLTAADCLPLQPDPKGGERLFFDLLVNGHRLHSRLETGAIWTGMNPAAARVLGVQPSGPNVHPLGGTASWDAYNATSVATVRLPIGRQRLRPISIQLYDGLPWQTGPDDPELDLGLGAIRDRLLFVSYSTHQICIGPPA